MPAGSEFLINEGFNSNRTFESSAKALANAFLSGQTNAKGVQFEAAKTALVNQQLADLQRKQQKDADEQAAFEKSLSGLQGVFDPSSRQEAPRLNPEMEGPMQRETLMQALQSPHGQAALGQSATDLIRGGGKADDFGDLFRVLASTASIGQEGDLDSLIQVGRSAAGDTPLGVNQAVSLEGQQNIFDRNEEAKPTDIKKVATNEFLGNMLAGRESSSGLTAAARAAGVKVDSVTAEGSDEDFFAPADTLPAEQTIFGQAEHATGPISTAIAAGANVAGLFGVDVGSEVTRSRQNAEIFSTRLGSALRVTGGKFAEGERLNLQKIIAIKPDFWTSAPVARQRMFVMDTELARAEAQNLADVRDPLLTQKARSDASTNLRTIKQARRVMGVPIEEDTGRRPDNTVDPLAHAAAGAPDPIEPVDIIPEGVDPADWEFLTPSERALWQL